MSSSSSSSQTGGVTIIDQVSSGFCVVGQARVGGNGAGAGHEFSVGHDTAAACATGRRTWDAAASGIDSGQVATRLTAGPGGGANLSLNVDGGNPSPLPYASLQYGAVTKVQIQARVTQTNAKFAFRNIQVTFATPGQSQQVIVVDAAMAPAADTTGGHGTSASQAIQVTPRNAGYTTVTVVAEVQLVCQDPAPAGPDAIEGSVYVFTESCAP